MSDSGSNASCKRKDDEGNKLERWLHCSDEEDPGSKRQDPEKIQGEKFKSQIRMTKQIQKPSSNLSGKSFVLRIGHRRNLSYGYAAFINPGDEHGLKRKAENEQCQE